MMITNTTLFQVLGQKQLTRLLLVIVFALMMPQWTAAQSSKLGLAERYFRSFDYKMAAKVYDDILDKNPNHTVALRQIALCNEKLGTHDNAVGYWKRLTTLDGSTPDDLLHLAEALKMSRDYREAHDAYVKYGRLVPDDAYAQQFVKNPDWAEQIIRDSLLVHIENSKINSNKSDFAPALLGNKVLFSSGKGNGKKYERKYVWTDQAYLNFYIADVDRDFSLKNASAVEFDVNTRYHEGTAALDSLRGVIYITRNNVQNGRNERAKDGVLNLGIYFGTYKDGVWGELSPFPYNNENHSVGHPTVSEDGQHLYFVSNMEGGKGGTDLYRCEKSGDSWGEPENLKETNSPRNEMFPYILGNDSLYFSSDGHIGLGGLDIFIKDFSDSTSRVRNVGYPLNSPFDDFGAVIRRGQENGYFTSNRRGGKGDDDIYEYHISAPDSLVISGVVRDKGTGLPISGALVYQKLPFAESEYKLIGFTDEEGSFVAKVPFDKKVTLVGSKDGFYQSETILKPTLRTTQINNAEIELEKFDFASEGMVYYQKDRAAAEGAIVTLYDEKGAAIDSLQTKKDGKYFFPLEKDRLYTVKCSKDDYSERSVSINTSDRIQGTIIYSDFELFKLEVGVTVELDNIYYDLAKWNIRPDAALELNKLVQLMVDNPGMKIELSSHTDARGRDSYNQSLSEKRARSAREYVVSQGVSATRVSYKGYGESKPVNGCVDGVNCTEAEHQENRRTEFTITGID